MGASLVVALVATTGAAAAPPAVAAADFPAKDSRYHTYAEMVAVLQAAGRPPGHRAEVLDRPELPGPRDLGRQGLRQRRDRRARARGPVRLAPPRPRAPHRSSRPSRILRWLTDGYGTDARITSLVERARDLDRLHGQPRRRRVRPDRRPVSRLAQEPPAERRLARTVGTDLNRNYDYQLGLLRRLVGLDGRRSRTAARRRSPRPRPGRCATSCSAAGSGASAADQGRDHVPHRRRGDPLAVRLHARPTSRPT